MSGNGKGPARMPVKHVVAGDGLITSPWFGPPRLKPDPKLAGRPWILTFVGTEKSFVDGFFEGVASSADDYAPAAFPPILAMRDFSEPPRALVDGSGAAAYVRAHVEPEDAARPVVGELAPDDDDPAATTLSELLPPGSLPASSDGLPSWLRKLYLPMHQHFHVVACQLDCKRPGAPRIDPKRVIEAGMVVRRFIAEPKGARPRWEDWIASPHGDGIWAEIASEDMTTIASPTRTIDPRALPLDVLDPDEITRLGTDLSATLKLSTSALQALPARVGDAALGEAAKHTARWGFLPVASSDKERSHRKLEDEAQTISDAFVKTAHDRFTARLVDAAGPMQQRISQALAPLLTGFGGHLPAPPSVSDAATARAALALIPGASVAGVNTLAGALALAVATEYAKDAVTSAGATNAARGLTWRSAVDVIAAKALGSPSPLDLVGWQPVPSWVQIALNAAHRATLTAILLDEAWKSLSAAEAGSSDARLLVGLLLWIRQLRGALLGAFYAAAYAPNPPPNPDKAPAPEIGPGETRPVGVGVLGAELDGWLTMNDARDKDPLRWPDPRDAVSPADFPVWRGVHDHATALEDVLSNIDAQGASVGSGYAQVLEAMAEETGAHLQKELGVAELRKIGIDLRAQPERGLLVFPGPSPTTASVSAVRDAVEAYYRNYTSASPTPVATASDLRTDGKALRQVTRPRYDSDSLYAVWCYARVAGKDRCDQPEIVWSRRTEVFFLAEPMDLLGLKPVSMRLPNLPKLMKDIPRMRKARALPFASMITPQDSGIKVGDDPKDTAREWGIAWICSFGIPIFTICAWILFKIIFSILIIIPGFAWMLLLKICIPVPAPVRKGA